MQIRTISEVAGKGLDLSRYQLTTGKPYVPEAPACIAL